MEYNTETDCESIMILPLKTSGNIRVNYQIDLRELHLNIWTYDYDFPIMPDQDLDETKQIISNHLKDMLA